MAVRPLTYVVLKEAALRTEEIEKEKIDREAKKKRPEGTSSFLSRPSGTMFRGSGFQRGNFRGRGTYGTVRPSGSTVSSSRSGPRSRGSGSDFRRDFGRSFNRGSSPQYAQCGRFYVGECWGINPVICYRCNQPGHYANSCPEGRSAIGYQSMSQSSVGENVMQTGMARGRGRSGRGGATTSSSVMQAAHIGQPQARVYAIT